MPTIGTAKMRSCQASPETNTQFTELKSTTLKAWNLHSACGGAGNQLGRAASGNNDVE